MTKLNTLQTLHSVYLTLEGNNLLLKHKALTGAVLEALEALGADTPRKDQAPYFTGTEVQALAYIHNTVFKHQVEDTLTDEQATPFYDVSFHALEALETAKSTCKEDTQAKLDVIHLQYEDYDLDEIQKITLGTLEHELTGVVGKWGLDSKEKTPETTAPTLPNEARAKQEDNSIKDAIKALEWLSSKGLKLSADTLKNLAKGEV